MPIFLLIRHGDTDYVEEVLAGRIDAPLTDYGRQQARKLAEVLSQQPIKAIYSSPMCRSVETAQPLADAAHLFLEMDPMLIQVDFGEWQGLSFDELEAREDWQTFRNDPSSIGCPGGETMSAVRHRVLLGLERIASSYEDDDLVAIFAHGSIIRHAITFFLDMPLSALNRVQIDPASVSALQVKDGKAVLQSLNWHYPPETV
ncbi:MAG: histidine phosphatase family protein [Anaerolineaceae bacterium]|jgi:probable phosphoglycerate mutase|nr:histidine phosphatase family protein [Anaerolineaceae bacterium]